MEGGEAGVMAVTKVFAIRVRLDDRVRYITDGEKTSLASGITYISTQTQIYLHCRIVCTNS